MKYGVVSVGRAHCPLMDSIFLKPLAEGQAMCPSLAIESLMAFQRLLCLCLEDYLYSVEYFSDPVICPTYYFVFVLTIYIQPCIAKAHAPVDVFTELYAFAVLGCSIGLPECLSACYDFGIRTF